MMQLQGKRDGAIVLQHDVVNTASEESKRFLYLDSAIVVASSGRAVTARNVARDRTICWTETGHGDIQTFLV